jgi:hypothetical protein
MSHLSKPNPKGKNWLMKKKVKNENFNAKLKLYG